MIYKRVEVESVMPLFKINQECAYFGNILSMVQYVMYSLQIETFFNFCERTIQKMYWSNKQH